MDYLTSFSQLFDCLLVLVCLSGNSTFFRLLDCIFDSLFGYLTVFPLFECLLTIWLSFGYLTVFRLFDSLSAFWLSLGYLTIFSAIWLSVGSYLNVFRLFDCLFGYLTVFLAIWLSFQLFDYLLAIWLSFGCLSAIWLSFSYLTVFWLFNCLLAILERHYNRTRMTLESH